MYRKYYSYNDMPRIPDIKEEKPKPKPILEEINEVKVVHKKPPENNKIFNKFEIDDVLLAVVAIVLLMDECDDKLLLLAIGFIFLTGFGE